MKPSKLLDTLNSFEPMSKNCKLVYCTTCGGKAYALRANMTPQLSKEINYALQNLSLMEFLELGAWCEYLYSTYRDSVIEIYKQTAQKLDLSDIRLLDCCLFHGRNIVKNTPKYNELLQEGIKIAIKTKDDSLVESLVIILDDKILNYNKLFVIALHKARFEATNTNIKKALYGSVRHKVPLVRKFG